MDPDAREGLPPLTHEENQSVLCLLVLPLASGNNVNFKKNNNFKVTTNATKLRTKILKSELKGGGGSII